MNGTFNGQILVEKLAKLNNSQQSIETLSHWCIFHRKKAKQVVETWDRQFHCSPQEQRVSFLYLANDILQNSRRKGSEFFGEFWKVLPDALSDVIENGDEFGRNAAVRMIDIWEERKVFGCRGQILKEELVGRNLDKSNRNGKSSDFKRKHCVGDTLEKISSSYQILYDGSKDEEALLGKCRTAVSGVEKAEKEIGGNYNSGQLNGSGVVDELRGQHSILEECIEQLRLVESSRADLISHLRDALQEQEFKLDQVRNQLKVAQSRYEQAGNICQQVLNYNNGQVLVEQRLKETNSSSDATSSFLQDTPAISTDKEQSAPVMYTQQGTFPDKAAHVEEPHKSAAAAMAAKLAASTSSAQMLTYVLSSLASEGVIGNPLSEPSSDYLSEKRSKLDSGPSLYMAQHSQSPSPLLPHPQSLQHPVIATSQQLAHQPAPPSPSPMSHPGPTMPQLQPTPLPPVPPPQAPQFMQTAGSITSVPYNYGTAQQPPRFPGYPMFGTSVTGVPSYPSPNPYQNFQGSEGGFYGHTPLPAMPPISRQ